MGDPTQPPYVRPSADVIAELIIDDYPWYTFCRVDDGSVGGAFGVPT